MRDIIYNELMKVYAYQKPQDPVYISNTCSDLADALTEYLQHTNDYLNASVLDEVAYRIHLVFDTAQGQAYGVAGKILNTLAIDPDNPN